MAAPSLSTIPSLPAIPPLENGDRLTRDEFERRYEAMPPNTRAELIEGIVYISNAMCLEHHGEPHCDLSGWLGVYRAHTPGVRCGIAATVRLDLGNEPQPDNVAFIDPRCGGQARLDADGYVADAPELVAEITASSASIDLGGKLEAYRRNRVREYVIWRVLDGTIDWLALRGAQFQPLAPGSDGVIRSEVFPGLWLDVAALLTGNMQRVYEVLNLGLRSEEHHAFVAKLQRQITPPQS